MKTSSFKLAAVCGILLAACSTSPHGRKQVLAPQEVSKAYSEADLRIHLATASSVVTPCAGTDCTLNQQFDQRVQELGGRLALAAYDLYPDLIKRVSAFRLEVVDKTVPGTNSNAAGKIVVLRGVQAMELDDASLAFLLAREMGHVIAQHHEENSGTRILLSIAAGVLFPALNLFNGSAQVAQQATQVTSASTLGTTVASTATSYLGSKAILASLKPDQLGEADTIALALAEREGWHLHDIAFLFEKADRVSNGGAWGEDLHLTVANLRKIDAEMQSTDLSQLPATLLMLRECRAEDAAAETGLIDADVAIETEPEEGNTEIPVMVTELTPVPEVSDPVPPAPELPAANEVPPETSAPLISVAPVAAAAALQAQPSRATSFRQTKPPAKLKSRGVASGKPLAKATKNGKASPAKKKSGVRKAPPKKALKAGKAKAGAGKAASKVKPAAGKKAKPAAR